MSRLFRVRQKTIAFTLIEVLSVIALIAILASIVLGSVQPVKERAGIARARAELACLAQALEDFKRHYGDYPRTGTAPGTATAAAMLFSALVGTGGPDGALDAGVAGPVFVTLSNLTLESAAELAAGNAPANSAFVDPWGRRYFYSYQRINPTLAGYLLFSAGPDGATTRSHAPDSFSDRRTKEEVNADDIVAGQFP